MNFMLSIHGENSIVDQIHADLRIANAKIINNPHCLCTYVDRRKALEEREFLAKNALEGVDILIYHPNRGLRTSYENCWETHRTIIRNNPNKRFYVFARFNQNIEEFLGQGENLRFFRGNNVRELWDEIKELAKK